MDMFVGYNYLGENYDSNLLRLWNDLAIFTDNGGLAQFNDTRIMQASKAEYVVMRGNSFDWKSLMQQTVYHDHFQRYYPFLLDLREEELAAIAMSLLIGDPSAELKKEMNEKSEDVDVSVHLRMGDAGLKHGSASRQSLQDLDCFVTEILDKCNINNRGNMSSCKLFISCDDFEASKILMKSLRPFNITLIEMAGTPLHVDQSFEEYNLIPANSFLSKTAQKDILFKAYSKTFADWYLLSEAEDLILSDSGFGFSAFYYSLGRHIMKKGEVEVEVEEKVNATKFKSRDQTCQWSNIIFPT